MTLPVVFLLAAVTFAVGYAFALLVSRSRTAELAEQKRTLGEQLADGAGHAPTPEQPKSGSL